MSKTVSEIERIKHFDASNPPSLSSGTAHQRAAGKLFQGVFEQGVGLPAQYWHGKHGERGRFASLASKKSLHTYEYIIHYIVTKKCVYIYIYYDKLNI